ncbi:cupin domain-containing protein [Paucibacter sp. R3-3]|uniref:Cupin domain-containing protein n=1 Tax=Roseateles agri TaxID=3098619 RepID=A0ABU5DEF8_9BURK|nr:cupin domain-containing protein [Paucibacter sp. R3-3]MDY0744665.1 cupin domain-containing protein [Paucibacter sp. R3-3]
MLIRADFSQAALVRAHEHCWTRSPQAGVERVMLDRVGGEQARATSLVRYAPGSQFPAHAHPGGEEILVLSGTFSADGEDHPAGCYLRNPPGSAHRPSSCEGALIFVKLGQMGADERSALRVDTRDPRNWREAGEGSICPLFDSAGEQVRLERLPPGLLLALDASGGAELLVLEGALSMPGQRLEPGSWLRLPAPGSELRGGDAGTLLYLKTGHLGDARR